MVVPTAPPLSLSSVGGKPLHASCDGGQLSSDAGVLMLREAERRLGLATRLASCINDPRSPLHTVHRLDDIIRFRTFMIACGYKDGNDANWLRADPAFKLALSRLPNSADLCSQSTISRLENLPDKRALLRMGRALVRHYCASFRQVPSRIVLDFDDTFDAAHGQQQLRLFNAYYDEYGFQPMLVFDGDGRLVAALLRPAKRPSGREAAAMMRRVVRLIRAEWPRVRILIRGDAHYCAPETLAFCRASQVDFIFGVAQSATLRKHVAELEASTSARQPAGPEKLRRFKEFHDGAASWPRVERIIARVEAGPQGVDTRFIATSLPRGSGRAVYEDIYCRRGCAENHIKAFKTHLAADRTSCTRAAANQFRLFLHAAAYWLLWSVRSLAPKRSSWRAMQFDTLRLRLLKIAACVVETKRRVRVHLPSAAPAQDMLRFLLGRMPRLIS
jgi:Transposase DDE domain group 1